jgi:predicted nucleic acid-binding protein
MNVRQQENAIAGDSFTARRRSRRGARGRYLRSRSRRAAAAAAELESAGSAVRVSTARRQPVPHDSRLDRFLGIALQCRTQPGRCGAGRRYRRFRSGAHVDSVSLPGLRRDRLARPVAAACLSQGLGAMAKPGCPPISWTEAQNTAHRLVYPRVRGAFARHDCAWITALKDVLETTPFAVEKRRISARSNLTKSRLLQAPEITVDVGRDIIDLLLGVSIAVHPMAPLLKAAYELAIAPKRATVYDCCYLALASALGCRLATADRPFYDAVIDGPLGAHLLWVADPT